MKNLFLMLAVCAFFACSPSTQIEKSWRDPNTTFTGASGQKVLIVGMVRDESSRRIIEDNLAKRSKIPAVQSYTLIDEEMLKAAKEDHLSDVLQKDGFTHVLLVRLVDVEKETSYVPGTTTGFYGGYGRFYGYGGGMYGTPGYYATDKNYFIETAVYTVSPDKLVYSATTKTVNPTQMDKTINDIADAVVMQMQKDGFIPKTVK
jgi:hypothetical protein